MKNGEAIIAVAILIRAGWSGEAARMFVRDMVRNGV